LAQEKDKLAQEKLGPEKEKPAAAAAEVPDPVSQA